MSESNYAPVGGMCRSCEHLNKDCSHLPFNTYKVALKSQDGWNYVACKEYTKRDKTKQPI